MKILTKTVSIHTRKEVELVNITGQVEEVVKESGVKEGVVTVFIPHTSAALTLTENEPGLERDAEEFLENLIPEEGGLVFKHHHFIPEYGRMGVNAPSHMKSMLLGNSVSIPVVNGKLTLGSGVVGRLLGQSIYLVELDGPKERRVVIQVMGT